MNALVINHCAHNKGDGAVLYFVLRELARNGISNITVSVSDRRFYEEDHSALGLTVRYVPYGWNVERTGQPRPLERHLLLLRDRYYTRIAYPLLRTALRHSWPLPCPEMLANREFASALKKADFVISTGGHHLTTLLVPDGVYPQTFDMGLVTAMRKRLALWSQSMGPFHFRKSQNRDLILAILSHAACIYLRDEHSLDELARLGISLHKVRQTYESVFGLHDACGAHRAPSQRDPLLGIAIYTQAKRTPEAYASYVRSWAHVIDHAVEKGWKPRLFPHEKKGSPADDRWCILDIVNAARHGPKCEIMDEDMSTLQHLEADQLVADGWALTVYDGTCEQQDVYDSEGNYGGSFLLTAEIDDSGTLVSGTLTIEGTVPTLGYNSGMLVTGPLTNFGFPLIEGASILEFTFNPTGGDLAALYGDSPGGIILSWCGFSYTGEDTFESDFDNLMSGMPGTGSAVCDVAPVPEPATMALGGLGLLALLLCKRRG